jgi:hypothetical protein
MVMGGTAGSVARASAEPVWSFYALADSTAEPGGTAIYRLQLGNVGQTATNGTLVTFTASFPAGLKATNVTTLTEAATGPAAWSCPSTTFPAAKVTCSDSTDSFPTGTGGVTMIQIAVAVNEALEPGVLKTATFELSGGGAASKRTAASITVGPLPRFGLSAWDGFTGDANGTPFTQAGGHPYESSVSFELNTRNEPEPLDGPLWPVAPLRDTYTAVPAGLIGNPSAVLQCTAAELVHTGDTGTSEPFCPSGSQVGDILIRANSKLFHDSYGPVPIFNMVPPPGVPARFGFNVLGVAVELDAKLRSEGDYGITLVSHGIPEGLPVFGSIVTLWGDPASPAHDLERACPGGIPPANGGAHCPSGIPEKAFLRNPTSCGGAQALKTTMSVDSWDAPGRLNANGLPDLSDPAWSTMSFVQHQAPGYPYPSSEWGAPVQIEGCDNVPVKGNLSAQTTSIETQVPTGLEVNLEVPNPGLENVNGIAASDLNAARVTLPVGVTINPSQAEGLGACSPQQYATEEVSFHPDPSHGCPSDSKIGTVEMHTQLLSEVVDGDVYIAKPHENPFGSLIALYVVLKSPERGVLIKIAGKVSLDPQTGRIVTTFEHLPQLPFEKFTFRFREGARAPLVTPSLCGTYQTEAQLAPWSDPAKPITSRSNFQIVQGIGGAACPSGSVPPFDPSVTTGSVNANAASYTPFYLRISRNDGEQELTRFSTVFPDGLTGNLTGIPFCPNAAIEAARTRTGQQELASPSCPAASEIGHSIVGAGVGSVLAHTPGKVYLAGPYHGASMSVVSITSATVGPFDLGTVVIRFALRINPSTAQVEIDSAGSDPIPHIIDGIVVHVKDIRVYVDRPNFILNPTSCDPMSISNAVTGTGADIASSSDDQTVNTATRFQVGNCSSLSFRPSFHVSTSSKPSRKNGESLDVKLTMPKAPLGTATNIAKVKVDLPRQLPSRLETLQKACLDSVFNSNPAACPAPSRVGTATAITPIVPVPLSGPVYFVSHGVRKFPDLVIVLQGYGITVDLSGETFISKKGLTSTTFRTVPDVPVGTFELHLPQGPYSALASNGSVCNVKGGLKMPTALVAHNGTTIHQNTKIAVSGCAKRHARGGRHAKRGKK